MVEKISAITLRVANMRASVRFYKDVLGLEIIYGSEGSYFTSLRTKDGDTILNLEHGNAGIRWGRLIFHVSDVDRFWAYLMEKGFHPDSPQDASWANVISICPILMAMSFHLLVRSSGSLCAQDGSQLQRPEQEFARELAQPGPWLLWWYCAIVSKTNPATLIAVGITPLARLFFFSDLVVVVVVGFASGSICIRCEVL